MTWVSTLAEGEIKSGRMNCIRGDADVYTKPGRTTTVTLKAERIRLSDDEKDVLVDVYYKVHEDRKDYTTLEWSDVVRLPVPVDAAKHTVRLMDTRPYVRSWPVRGKHHGEIDVPEANGTLIEGSTIRIDGKGDDEENAYVHLRLHVPIQYDDVS